MLLTTEQVANKLNVHTSTVLRLVKIGQLTPANARSDGKRTSFRFESSAINAFKQTYEPKADHRRRTNGRAAQHPAFAATTPTTRIVDAGGPRSTLAEMLLRLDALEAGQREIVTRLDALLKVWG